MKRSLLLSLLMLVCTAVFAQPPHYYVGGSTATVSWPFNANNQKVQFLYLPGQFTAPTPAQSGIITSLWFRPRTSATNVLIEDLEIKMGQTTATTFNPATTFVTTGMMTVHPAADVSIPTVTACPANTTQNAGCWIEFPLTTPFTYDNTKSLIVEVSQTAVTNGFELWFQPVASSPARTITGTTGSSSGSSYVLHMAAAGVTVMFPCAPPYNFSATNITPTSVDLDWQNLYPNVKAYEMVINQSPTPPPVPVPNSSNYVTVTPPVHIDTLRPNNCYYVHLKTNCFTGAYPDSFASSWTTDSFCTIATCDVPPVVIDVAKITSTQALVVWSAVPNVTKYEYAVSIDTIPPQKGLFTTYTQVLLKGLHSNWPYYFHVRAYCSTGEPVSPWGLTPFHTAITTDVDDLQSGDFAIEAYPNPAGNIVTIMTAGRSNNAKITIVDMTGKLVKAAEVTEDRTTVNLDGLTAGLYFIRYNDEIRSEVIKLTKQ